MSSDTTHTNQETEAKLEYLRELLADRSMLANDPIAYVHVIKLLEKEILRIRIALFAAYGIYSISDEELPAPEGPKKNHQMKVYMPVTDRNSFNFVGRILGPDGSTAKCLQHCLGVKIMVRGQGSVRDRKKEEYNLGKPKWEHLSDSLHVVLSVEDHENRAKARLTKASKYINKFLEESMTFSDKEDKVKQMQLMELSIRQRQQFLPLDQVQELINIPFSPKANFIYPSQLELVNCAAAAAAAAYGYTPGALYSPHYLHPYAVPPESLQNPSPASQNSYPPQVYNPTLYDSSTQSNTCTTNGDGSCSQTNSTSNCQRLTLSGTNSVTSTSTGLFANTHGPQAGYQDAYSPNAYPAGVSPSQQTQLSTALTLTPVSYWSGPSWMTDYPNLLSQSSLMAQKGYAGRDDTWAVAEGNNQKNGEASLLQQSTMTQTETGNNFIIYGSGSLGGVVTHCGQYDPVLPLTLTSSKMRNKNGATDVTPNGSRIFVGLKETESNRPKLITRNSTRPSQSSKQQQAPKPNMKQQITKEEVKGTKDSTKPRPSTTGFSKTPQRSTGRSRVVTVKVGSSATAGLPKNGYSGSSLSPSPPPLESSSSSDSGPRTTKPRGGHDKSFIANGNSKERRVASDESNSQFHKQPCNGNEDEWPELSQTVGVNRNSPLVLTSEDVGSSNIQSQQNGIATANA